MVLEWCVPTCHASFRQAVAGERWMRKLVDLCRKDATEQALVRQTIAQLIANWAAWYAGAAACAGFERCEMLRNQGAPLPLPASRSEMIEGGSGSAVADGTPAELPAAEARTTRRSRAAAATARADARARGHATVSDGAGRRAKVDAELEIMREDISQLEATLKQCAAGSGFRASTGQTRRRRRRTRAAGRRGSVPCLVATRADEDCRPEALSTETREQIDALLSKIDSLLHQWEEVAPVERRNRAAHSLASCRPGRLPVTPRRASALPPPPRSRAALSAACRCQLARRPGRRRHRPAAARAAASWRRRGPPALPSQPEASHSARSRADVGARRCGNRQAAELGHRGGAGRPTRLPARIAAEKARGLFSGGGTRTRWLWPRAVAVATAMAAESPQMRHLDLAVSQESARARKRAAGGGDGGGLKLDLAHLDLAMPDGTAAHARLDGRLPRL